MTSMSVHQTSRTRVRAANRLSAVRVAKTKAPGLYEDGAGLRLIVTGTGSKRWALRLTINGRRVERGLGLYPSVTLEEARTRADEMRRAARRGVDARAESRTLRGKMAVTFSDAFDAFFAARGANSRMASTSSSGRARCRLMCSP